MKKLIIFFLVSVFAIIYAYGFDLSGYLNSSNNYSLNGNITPNQSGQYIISVACDYTAQTISFHVTDLVTGLDVVNQQFANLSAKTVSYNVIGGRSYAVYIGTGNTPGYGLTEPGY